MSRFDREWALVPDGARWTAALVCLAVTALVGGIFLLPAFAERDPKAVLMLSPFFLLIERALRDEGTRPRRIS